MARPNRRRTQADKGDIGIMEGIKGVYLKNMQLVKEGKLVCKQKKCRFYNDCDNYSCSYLEPVDNLTESEVRE